ncbi:MAG: hypothetical protein JXA21_08815 [Anaerolineae bacterium]|nr:hypothetical protein [Anaerolineae bacterium]
MDNKTRAAFEAALGHDETLRRKVDALRTTVNFVRSVPMREPPRNYLLTPAMVKKSHSIPARQRRPALLWLRLATSLSAIAFVITFGLNFLIGVSPKMASQKAYDAGLESKVITTAGNELPKADEDERVEEDAMPLLERQAAGEELPPNPVPMDGSNGEMVNLAPAAAVQGTPQLEQESSKAVGGQAITETITVEGMPEWTAETGDTFGEHATVASDVVTMTVVAHSPTQDFNASLQAPPTPGVPGTPASSALPTRLVTAILGVITLVLAFITFRVSQRS